MDINYKNTILSQITEENCTGCGACKNICPVDAIELREDEEGFLFPFIDCTLCVKCEKCLKTCPVINPENTENNSHPEIFAFRASDEVRQKSSSGGVFTIFAEYILKNNGYVIGAAFDEKFKLHHIIAENPEELNALRKSKYLQSNTEWIYRNVKEKLEKGRTVLFTGCPCQIAALYSFLGRDYDCLYTIDILCHGVPSQKLFDEYLTEISDNLMPSKVDFRDKKHGWTAEFIDIIFSDGKHYERSVNSKRPDAYERGFLQNLTLRPSCYNCSFCEIPRQADLTMGDFWGINSVDPSQNDGKGTSILLINNAKGSELFSHIKDDCIIEKIEIDPTTLPNRFNRFYPANLNRQRFFDLVKTHTFKKAVEQALDGKHDIGLVGNYRAGNFGGALTYFCLYQVLKDMGYSVLMIERPLNAKVLPVPLDFLFRSNPYPDWDVAPLYNTKSDMTALNQNCDIFVVGSDQLFQNDLYKELGSFVTLDWVTDNKLKIAYAASFGRDYFWGDYDTTNEMAYFIQKFDAFSVREKSGIEIVEENFGMQADWVMDPVFLCNKQHFQDMVDKVCKERVSPYLGSYILDPTKEKNDMIRFVADNLGLDTEVFSEMNYSSQPEYVEPLNSVKVVDYKVDERVECIMHCDFFITDSFHGTCLSIIFKKPFITILNAPRGGERFKSLLTHLGLEGRLIEDINYCDIKALINEPIDFSNANEILEKDIIFSRQWLINALTIERKKTYSDYDIMCQMLEKQENEIKQLNQKITKLMRSMDLEITEVEDIFDYLDLLIKKKDQLIIIIAVKDTPGFSLDENINQKLNKLGFKKDITNKHWHSYIGILNAGRIVFERLSQQEEPVTYNGKIQGITISVKSASWHQGNLASIIINDREEAINKRGLNFVILNRKSGRVIDSVCFDTHSKNLNCYRN